MKIPPMLEHVETLWILLIGTFMVMLEHCIPIDIAIWSYIFSRSGFTMKSGPIWIGPDLGPGLIILGPDGGRCDQD